MKAYIFDLDGTLLDSTGVWDEIDHSFLQKRGIAVPPDYADAIAPMTFTETANYTIERFGLSESPESLMREWRDMAIDIYSTSVELKPYAKELLLALHERRDPLAVATSATEAVFRPALRRHGIHDLFDVICTSEEAGYGKTRPDVFLLTAERLGVSPHDCIVFEDILAAIKSAKSIGMTVYGVYDAGSKRDWEEIKQIADGVIYDFRDVPLPK